MEQLQKAIENITYFDKKFPKKEFEIISANRDAAIPYLRSAVEKAIEEKDGLDEGYQLHFYAMYLLAQFQDREFFPKMVELFSLPTDTLDALIGDALTESVGNILYNTYNGDIELIKQAIFDIQVDDYVKSAMLDVMGQLYLDQSLTRQEWQDFLRAIVYGKESIGDYVYTAVAHIICKCHFIEMLPEIRKLYQDELVDEYAIGGYDECVDCVFEYRTYDKEFCKSPIDAAKTLSGWAMFEQSSMDKKKSEKELSKLRRDIALEARKAKQKESVKVGRNDPCPCGSGKKYKKCCMDKPQNTAATIESQQEREKWLQYYPPAKTEETEETEGRIYLEDFYSQESIEIDKLLYLAMKHRVIPLWEREPKEVATRRERIYLADAYKRFKEFIEREKIASFSEYDDKYAIHYFCDEWIGRLCELLEESDEEGLLGDVREIRQKMQ